MTFRSVTRNSPEQGFMVITNATAYRVEIGRGLMFDYVATTRQNGYEVVNRADTTQYHMGMLAGIVVERGIDPSDIGLVQVFGHCDSIFVHNLYGSTNPLSGINAASLGDIRLDLNTGTLGGFSPYPSLVAAHMTVDTRVRAHFNLINPRVDLGTWCYAGETVNTHTNAHTSGYVKGFIRGL